MKKAWLLAAGSVCLLLALIGLVLPVWPTTPFVLVSAACFAGFPAIYDRLCRLKMFREYIEHYRYHTPVSTASRIKSLIWLWGMLIVSMVVVGKLWLTLTLIGIGAAVTAHILVIGRGETDGDDAP